MASRQLIERNEKDGGRLEDSRPLRYRTYAIWLLGAYVPLLVIPWILTCVLSHRPLNPSSYIQPQGLSNAQVASLHNWKTAVDVLNSIAAVVTIPVLSALLAQAAVVFSQRRRQDEFLSLQDLFALADRRWTNVPGLWKTLRASRKGSPPGAKRAGFFLWPAAGLVLLGALQQPLYQVLVHFDAIAVTTCGDTYFRHGGRNGTCEGQRTSTYTSLGYDIEPAQMASIYHDSFMPRMKSDLASISIDEAQPNFWIEDATPPSQGNTQEADTIRVASSLRHWVMPNIYEKDQKRSFFVSALRTNATTGVLREHSMRLNSSVKCEPIPRSSFPSQCAGEGPFATSFKIGDAVDVRICVPGKIGVFPWSLSRNRQDITEDLYLDVWHAASTTFVSNNREYNMSGTVRCGAKTTRGYFELGNLRNGNLRGPLIDRWPSREEMKDEFNDWVDGKGYIPAEIDTYAGDKSPDPSMTRVPSQEWRTSGPLALSAIALFGNTSWFDNIMASSANLTYDNAKAQRLVPWQRICEGMPFSKLYVKDIVSFPVPILDCQGIDLSIAAGFKPDEIDVLDIRRRWLSGFVEKTNSKDVTHIESLLQICMFVANRAILTFYSPTVTGDSGVSLWRGRTVYAADGQLVQKPIVSTAALAVLSTLLVLQLLGLAYLAYYIYHVPTWTDALDALSIARIGASLGQRGVLPPLGSTDRQHLKALREVDALVGVHDGIQERETLRPRVLSDEASDTDVSDIEMQQPRTKGAYLSVNDASPPVTLGLGASGLIHRDSHKDAASASSR